MYVTAQQYIYYTPIWGEEKYKKIISSSKQDWGSSETQIE
jgi:hypothetical protein